MHGVPCLAVFGNPGGVVVPDIPRISSRQISNSSRRGFLAARPRAELLVNLVKESLLSMVRIMFAHAARAAVAAQPAHASGHSVSSSGPLAFHGSNNSLADSAERLGNPLSLIHISEPTRPY